MVGGDFPQDLSGIQEYSAEVCYTWLEAEPSQLIYFVPVGPCGLWGSAHILPFSHKQLKHLIMPMKGMAAVSVMDEFYHEIREMHPNDLAYV